MNAKSCLLLLLGLVLIAIGAADYLLGFTIMPVLFSGVGAVLIAFGFLLDRKPKSE